MDLLFDHHRPMYRSRYHDRDLFNGYELAPRRIFSRPSRNWSTTLDQILRNQQLTEMYNKDGFQENVNVKNFKPEEVTVKIVDDIIVIEGKHEERQDNSSDSRHFVRKFTLPKGCDPNEVVSTLSADGVLTIKVAPIQKEPVENKERSVHIQQTGPSRDSHSESSVKISESESVVKDSARSVQIQPTGPARESIKTEKFKSVHEKKIEKVCCF